VVILLLLPEVIFSWAPADQYESNFRVAW